MVDLVLMNITAKLEEIASLIADWFNQHIVNILVILVGAWLVRHFGTRLFSRLLKHTVRADLYPTKADREKRIKTLNSLVGAFTRAAVYVIAAILLVGEINPSYTAALFTSAGLIGAAIGFGAKDIINDFVRGIFIIVENQYRIGDIISAAGVSGIVEDITIRTTVLRDLDGDVHHIPNGSIGVTTNKTAEYSQVNEDIMVGYGTDTAKLEHVIKHVGEEIAAHVDFKSKIIEPPHFERIISFADNGIVVKILARTTPGDQWLVKGELYKRLKAAFERHDIEIPYPQLVLHETKKAKR
jgi:moderate conductance mechanosensitive channel